MAGRQADRLDRHAAPVWRPQRARRGVSHSRRSRARHHARHGLGLRRQAHRRSGDRSGAAREGRKPPGQACLDARRGVHLGILPSGRRDRREVRRGRRRAPRVVGVRQLELRVRRASGRPTSSRISRSLFTRSKSPLRQGSYRALASTANHYAREMHMDTIARALGVDAVAVPPAASRRRAHRGRAQGGRGEDRLAEAVDAVSRARHRVRHREGRIRRDRRSRSPRRLPASRSIAS